MRSCHPPVPAQEILTTSCSIFAYYTNIIDPFQYYADQALYPVLSQEHHFPAQALSLSLQLGNVLLLLAAMAVICCFSSSRGTAKWYLIAVAFADYGHIYASYRAVGPGVFWDPSQWNDMIAGNVGASVVLNLARWLTVLGVFGQLGQGTVEGSSPKKRV